MLDPEPWAAELAERIEAAGVQEDDDEDAENEVDELEGSEGSSESKSKKRKRDSDAGKKKAANKKSAAKKDAGGEGKKKGGRKSQTKSKANIESEDETGPNDAKEEPPAKRTKRDDEEGKWPTTPIPSLPPSSFLRGTSRPPSRTFCACASPADAPSRRRPRGCAVQGVAA